MEIKRQYIPGSYRSKRLQRSGVSSAPVSVAGSGYTASHGHSNKEVLDLFTENDLKVLAALGVSPEGYIAPKGIYMQDAPEFWFDDRLKFFCSPDGATILDMDRATSTIKAQWALSADGGLVLGDWVLSEANGELVISKGGVEKAKIGAGGITAVAFYEQ